MEWIEGWEKGGVGGKGKDRSINREEQKEGSKNTEGQGRRKNERDSEREKQSNEGEEQREEGEE